MSSALRFVTALVLPLILAAPALAGGDWTGKIVVVKGLKRIQLIAKDGDGKEVALAELLGIDHRVLKEQDGKLKVRNNSVEGWVDKNDLVVLEEAVAYFTGRLQTNDSDAQAYAYRGWAHKLQGKVDLALQDYGDALRHSPNEPAWWNNRGNILRDKKDYDQAIEHYGQAIRINPKNPLAYRNRGLTWVRKKDYDRAIEDYGEVIRLDPKNASAYLNRGMAWAHKKDHDRAMKDYDEALRLDPKDAQICNSLAWFLATSPEARFRDGKRAVPLARKACELSDWKDPGLIDTLAAACAEAGDFGQAMKYQRQALDFPSFAKEEGRGARDRLRLYEMSKPYREP